MFELIEFEPDKLTEVISVRVPEITKAKIDKLTRTQRNRMNTKILMAISETLHEFNYDPNLYLRGD